MSRVPRTSIFDTMISRVTINAAQLQELVNFIVYHRQDKLDTTAVRTMLGTRALTATPMGTLFTRALELHKETLFSFMRIPLNAGPAPEVITYSHVTFDLKQLATPTDRAFYDVVQKLPGFADSIFLNVTSLLRRSGEPIDTLGLQSSIVRDLLSRSYYDSTSVLWLTPPLINYLCRFYNMSLAATIAGVFNLSYQEQQAVATIFSLYFLQCVSDTETAEQLVRTMKLGLANLPEINDIITRVKDTLGPQYAQMSLEGACMAVNALGLNRLAGVNRGFLYTRLKNIGPDALTSTLALEYPPYWCYLVLATMSGRKMGLTNTFKRNDLQREATSFADNLLHTQTFLPSL